MSIRLHRVKKIVYGNEFTRNTSKIVSWLDNNCHTNDQTNMDGGGMMEFTLEGLKEALEAINDGSLEVESFEKEALIEEIKGAEEDGYTDDDYIQYDCF